MKNYLNKSYIPKYVKAHGELANQDKEDLNWQLADAQQAERQLENNDTVIVGTDGQLIVS